MNAFEEYQDELTSAQILAGDREKSKVLLSCGDMRRDVFFCDAAFACQGNLFRCHKVIVSSWSRWLRSLLLEGADEVLSLDIFDPTALGAVLDYMYGTALTITVETADELLKVIRRLELQDLEQQCWRFLISVMSEENCNILHELADRYDCPPLKLAAFRMLQETDPSYQFAPINWDVSTARDTFKEGMNSHSGLTGPGEKSFYTMGNLHDDHKDEDDENFVSILEFTKKENIGGDMSMSRNIDDEDLDEEYDDDGNLVNRSKNRKLMNTVFPDQLPATATATEVVRAWATRLQYVYEQCMPYDNGENKYGEDFYENIVQSSGHVGGTGTTTAGASKMVFHYSKVPIRRNLQLSSNDPNLRRGPEGMDWKGELKRFYLAIKMPEKISSIDDILKTWEGKEDQMLAALLVKYKKLIPKSLLDHFDSLQNAMETQTESSFVHNPANSSPVPNNNPGNGPLASQRSTMLGFMGVSKRPTQFTSNRSTTV